MTWIVWVLVAIAMIVLWLILSAVFIPLGKIAYVQWKKLNDKLNKEIEVKEEKGEKEHEIR